MSARSPRRSFAQPLVITLAGAASLAACNPPPPQPPHVNPPGPQRTDAATWKVETDGDHCVASLCDGDACEAPVPYDCIPGRPTVMIFRQEGEAVCNYNEAEPPPPMDCPPDMSCNPPPPEWKPIAVRCPDA